MRSKERIEAWRLCFRLARYLKLIIFFLSPMAIVIDWGDAILDVNQLAESLFVYLVPIGVN